MSGFCLIRATAIRDALPKGFIANDGMGYFILWIVQRMEKGKINAHIISIPNATAARELGVSSKTIARWKHILEAAGIITLKKGKSLFLLNSYLIHKGKMRKS